MAIGIRLRVWGDLACFTRPEMKAERVSYDVMTPSAARAILEAVHWKPSIRWVVDRIEVINPIRFTSIRRNELEKVISYRKVKEAESGASDELGQVITEERQQRASLLLRDVEYVIHAHFEIKEGSTASESPEKHYNIFVRRARAGQCFHRPYLGCREFAAHFSLLEDVDCAPISYYSKDGQRDLGWILWDIDFARDMQPRFFRAELRDGILQVPNPEQMGVDA